MSDIAEGQTATNPKTGQKIVFRGGQWHNAGAATGGGKVVAKAGGKLSATAEKFLNELATQAQAAEETNRVYKAARPAINRLRTGPGRGMFLDAALPSEGGGMLDTIGATVIGTPARMLGLISPQETNDYQSLKRAQGMNVLTRQLLQKGPQTESDAARLATTEVSPRKTVEANHEAINAGIAANNRARAQAVFMQSWTSKYGSPNAPNPQGMTATQVWQQAQDHITEKLFPTQKTSNGPVIRRVR